jgi:uncharacterized integral membrane protein
LSFLKIFLFMLFLVVLVWFVVPNVDQRPAIRFIWPVGENVRMPLAIALVLAFVLGVLAQYILGLFRDIKAKTRIHRLQRENKKLQEQIERIRRAPIEEIGRVEGGNPSIPPAPSASTSTSEV